MKYQLKYRAGYEIAQFVDFARVIKDCKTVFKGTQKQCEKWLAKRGIEAR